jgi:hypothetical protein
MENINLARDKLKYPNMLDEITDPSKLTELIGVFRTSRVMIGLK